MLRIAIIGATGYTGLELIRLALKHPKIAVEVLTSEKQAGIAFEDAFPAFYKLCDRPLEKFDAVSIAPRIDFAFLCLPHHASMHAAFALRSMHIPLVDLSADFRLRSKEQYEAWYGTHAYPELLNEAVYGLPELYREKISHASFVANPGCYPTSASLALAPLIERRYIDLASIVIDSKSGVSGAGRNPEIAHLFSEIHESFRAYKVASHRHQPEIEQTLSDLAGSSVLVTFTPHLVPMSRGMLTTVYCKPLVSMSPEEWQQIFEDFYRDHPFVRVKKNGTPPNTRDVLGTNFCDIACVPDLHTGRLIVLSAIDNLTKGAAGQAIQNFNLMNGFDEKAGLDLFPFFP